MADMTRDKLRRIAEQYNDAFGRHDLAALTSLHAVDGVVESPMYATLKGRKAIGDAWRAFFTSFPDAAITVDAVVVDPPNVATFSTISATHVNEFYGLPGTNRRIVFRNSRLLVFDGGLIVKERRIYDFTGVLVQVGVLRARPSRPLDD